MGIEIAERVRRAEEYYSEFRGEPLWDGEELAPEDYAYVMVYKPMPVSFGFEFEQRPDDISPEVRGMYRWEHDLSGPLETALPPAIHPGRAIFGFLRRVGPHRWEWKGEYDHIGCGSHMHFRVREELVPDVVEAWTCLYNTLVECVPLMLPLFSAWVAKPYRTSVGRWAYPNIRRFNPARMAYFLRPEWHGREYNYVTLNRHRGVEKPLTIEVRLVEAHPAFSYTAAILLNRIVRKCFERGFLSPKLHDRVRVLRETLDRLYADMYAGRMKPAYAYLEETADLRFVREIPGLARSYGDALELFDDLLLEYLPRYPPLARVGRLLLNRGDPRENPSSIWDIWVPMGEFRWERGPEVL